MFWQILIILIIFVICIIYGSNTKTRKNGNTEKEFNHILEDYFPNDITKIVFSYIADIPTNYKIDKVFKTKSNPNCMCGDDEFLYCLEENASIVRKYYLTRMELVKSWKYEDNRKYNDIFICDIAVCQEWVVIINFLLNHVSVFTKYGELKTQFVFNFVAKPFNGMRGSNEFINYVCLEMTKPIHEREDWIKINNKDNLSNRISMYSLVVNSEFIYIGFGDDLLKLDMTGNILHNWNFYDVESLFTNGEEIITQTYNSIYKVSDPTITCFKIPKGMEGPMCNGDDRGIKIAVFNNYILMKRSGGFILCDLNGENAKMIKNCYDLWCDKYFVKNHKIYMLVDGTRKKAGNMRVQIFDLIY